MTTQQDELLQDGQQLELLPDAEEEMVAEVTQFPEGAAQPQPVAPLEQLPPPPPALNQDENMMLRQIINKQKADNDALTAQQMRVAVEQAQLQYQAQLEQQGYEPEQAAAMAQERMALQMENMGLRQQITSDRKEMEAKVNAARYIASKYPGGATFEQLMRFSTPEDMEREAMREKRFKDQDARISELQEKRVPAGQHFESGQGQAMSSTSARRQQLRNKQGPLTDAEFAELGKYLGQG